MCLGAPASLHTYLSESRGLRLPSINCPIKEEVRAGGAQSPWQLSTRGEGSGRLCAEDSVSGQWELSYTWAAAINSHFYWKDETGLELEGQKVPAFCLQGHA